MKDGYSTAGAVAVWFASGGRFSSPSTLWSAIRRLPATHTGRRSSRRHRANQATKHGQASQTEIGAAVVDADLRVQPHDRFGIDGSREFGVSRLPHGSLRGRYLSPLRSPLRRRRKLDTVGGVHRGASRRISRSISGPPWVHGDESDCGSNAERDSSARAIHRPLRRWQCEDFPLAPIRSSTARIRTLAAYHARSDPRSIVRAAFASVRRCRRRRSSDRLFDAAEWEVCSSTSNTRAQIRARQNADDLSSANTGKQLIPWASICGGGVQ